MCYNKLIMIINYKKSVQSKEKIMNNYKCNICGFIHDESTAGKWNLLPSGWMCPLCKMGKDKFSIMKTGSSEQVTEATSSKHLSADIRVPIELDNPSICRDDDTCIK